MNKGTKDTTKKSKMKCFKINRINKYVKLVPSSLASDLRKAKGWIPYQDIKIGEEKKHKMCS